MTPRHREILKELDKLQVKFIKRIESNPPRLQFKYDVGHPLDVYHYDDCKQIHEKLIELGGPRPTYIYHGSLKTIEVTTP